ncbi:hypothetical protein FHT86_000393 [Rhizobium sp. BK313]|uniref:hypothetical protein n=1 Tax=Rhizobium sp. BK313 TaxID=2587081 RepID=UPI0010600B97|nr:hypothetical protein [Rhizobium sp. BK313]MBB3452137.1 hypothetical protein [Rhizobium sp. BK313]
MTDSTLSGAIVRPSMIARLLGWRRAWLEMDKNPDMIRFAGTVHGSVIIHAAFFAVLLLAGLDIGFGTAAIAIAGLIGCALLPSKRALVIAASTLVFLIVRPFHAFELAEIPPAIIERLGLTGTNPKILAWAATALFMIAAWIALYLQGRYRETLPAKRPLLSMIMLFWLLVLLAVAGMLPALPQAFLWTFLAAFASGFWFLAYALADQKAKDSTRNGMRLGLFHPFWDGPPLPTGKGAAYLKKFEVKDETSLAVTRLKALKLIVWGALLTGLYIALTKLLNDYAGLPTLHRAMELYAAGTPVPAYEAWAALVVHYLLDIAFIAGWSHVIVAIVRMAGYAIPRNTVRPLSSRTLAEFWNRYYFYFKELLVDFFFFPAFLRYFKKQPKLRVAFATLCAASFGNVLFHFTWNLNLTLDYGLLGAMQHFESYAVYSLLLAGGLIISQLRGRKPKPEDGFLRYEVLPRIGVGLFFCLVAVFNETPELFTMHDRVAFFFSLFGVM